MKLVFKELEKALEEYRETAEAALRDTILTLLARNAAAGEFWMVLAETDPEDEPENTSPEKETTLRKLPAFCKQMVTEDSGRKCFCAFTMEGKQLRSGMEGTWVTVGYPLWDLLWELVETEEGDGLLVNPGTDAFLLSREEARDVLQRAFDLTDWEVCQMRTYHPKPRAVLDTNKILESWNEGWTGSEKVEEWKLHSYPIMADGRVLVLFEMRDPVYDGTMAFRKTDWISHFRLLEYELKEDDLCMIGQYRFKAQSPSLGCCTLYDGVLKAILRHKDKAEYTVLPILPENDEGQFCIFSDVGMVISNSKGELIVGYSRNLYDKEHLPLMIFDEKGEITAQYFNEDALYCSDVNLDKNEDVWFHMYPCNTIQKLVPKEKYVKSYKVALPGFHAFAMNDDNSLLFLWFSEYEGGSVQYVLSRDEDGDYGDPVRFAFLPEDEDGNILTAMDCREEYGRCSTMKSRVILNADNKLYLYDLNDCPDLGVFHHTEHPCPVCGKHVFKERDDDEVCPVCGWKDSTEQVLRPDKALKENKMSFHDARRMWKEGTPLGEFVFDRGKFADYDNLKNGEHLCPVCGQYEFEEFGSFDICPHCDWEDDMVPVDEKDGELIYDEEDEAGTCNPCCLREAKEKWEKGIPLRDWKE